MAIWLLKTEPDIYSFADLERDGTTMWDSVTQPHALQNLRKIAVGDTAIIYHTGAERAAVGLAEVSRGYYINPEMDDVKLAVCDVKATRRLQKSVSLAQIKARAELQDWNLVRLARLSVVAVSDAQFKVLLEMAEDST